MSDFKRRVAVDIDGVLADANGWKGQGNFGPVIAGSAEFCAELQRRGYEVVIFSSRTCEEMTSRAFISQRVREIEAWLKSCNIPYDVVWVGGGKPACTAYVDDRAVSCRPTEESNAFHTALEEVDKLDKHPI